MMIKWPRKRDRPILPVRSDIPFRASISPSGLKFGREAGAPASHGQRSSLIMCKSRMPRLPEQWPPSLFFARNGASPAFYSPSPNTAQLVARMKARRTLRSSQSEGGSASENFARYPAVYRGELHLTGSEQTGAAGSYGWGAAKGEVFWTFERV